MKEKDLINVNFVIKAFFKTKHYKDILVMFMNSRSLSSANFVNIVFLLKGTPKNTLEMSTRGRSL